MIRFSVITAVRNGAATISDLIESVASQDLREVELVVQDGGSTDGTLELLSSGAPVWLRWASSPDSGIYQAWNRALTRAQGEWLIFLGADDFLHAPDVLSRAAAGLDAAPESIEVAYGRMALVSRDGRPIEESGMPWPRAARRLPQEMSLPHPAVFYRRGVFARVGGFDESFRIAGDYEMLLRALRGREARFLPGLVVSTMRAGGASQDPARAWTVLAETYRARRIHVSRWPGARWLAAAARLALRRLLWRALGERSARRVLDGLRRLGGRPPYWTLTE